MTRKEILEKTIDFDDAIHRIVRLEEENAKLKSECRRCVHTDCLCVPSDFGKNRIGICVNFKDVFEKNAELEEELEGFRLKLEALEGQTPWKDMKDKSELIGKLTKAKELLTRFVMASVCFNGKEIDLIKEAEQFLKEIEK